MALGFGLDIAGFSGGKSSLAAVSLGSELATVTILKGHSFLKKVHGDDSASAPLWADRQTIMQCLALGPIAIDVPIDLQGLPTKPTCDAVWGMTRRPVDRCFSGLAPLADKIGAPVARVLNILRATGLAERVGSDILETYPAASLRVLGISNVGYKSSMAYWDGDAWHSENNTFRSLLHDLNFVSDEPITVTDDDLDAVLCGLVAAAPASRKLSGDRLNLHLAAELPNFSPPLQGPRGYELLAALPCSTINISSRIVGEFFNA